MAWKDTVNRTLYRATGYVLTNETPEQRREAIRAASRRSAARARKRAEARHRRVMLRQEARRAERAARRDKRYADKVAQLREERAARKRAQAKVKREAAKHLATHDDELREIVARVQPRTMTGAAKLAPLVEATRHVSRHGIPGDVVECGVWRGGSMQAVALTLLALGDTDRELHLFDTFEGMPPPTEEDARTTESGRVSAEEMLAASGKDSRLWAVAGLEDVQEGMDEIGYPAEKIHLHPGLVEDTTPGQAPEQIAILRLDTDWYASTKHELEHLYDRLSPGGVLILDDYGDWEGARKATDDWLAKTSEQLFLVPMGSGRIAVKPA